jgi:hypothetical protein
MEWLRDMCALKESSTGQTRMCCYFSESHMLLWVLGSKKHSTSLLS